MCSCLPTRHLPYLSIPSSGPVTCGSRQNWARRVSQGMARLKLTNRPGLSAVQDRHTTSLVHCQHSARVQVHTPPDRAARWDREQRAVRLASERSRGCDGSWSTAGDHWRMTPPHHTTHPLPPVTPGDTRIWGCSADTQGGLLELGAWNTPHKDQSQANVTAHLASRPPPFPAAAPQLRCPSISADSIRTPPFATAPLTPPLFKPAPSPRQDTTTAARPPDTSHNGSARRPRVHTRGLCRPQLGARRRAW